MLENRFPQLQKFSLLEIKKVEFGFFFFFFVCDARWSAISLSSFSTAELDRAKIKTYFFGGG
jgi:hypothetical protein